MGGNPVSHHDGIGDRYVRLLEVIVEDGLVSREFCPVRFINTKSPVVPGSVGQTAEKVGGVFIFRSAVEVEENSSLTRLEVLDNPFCCCTIAHNAAKLVQYTGCLDQLQEGIAGPGTPSHTEIDMVALQDGPLL